MKHKSSRDPKQWDGAGLGAVARDGGLSECIYSTVKERETPEAESLHMYECYIFRVVIHF